MARRRHWPIALGPHRYCSPGSASAPDRLQRSALPPSGLSTWPLREPAAALASPWQNAWAAPKVSDQRAQDGALDKPHARHRFDTLDAVAPSHNSLGAASRHLLSASRAPAPRLSVKKHSSSCANSIDGQPPPRAGGHPPPRARLHAPHARRRLRDPRRRVDAPPGPAQRRRRRVGRRHTRTQALLHVEAEPDPPAAPAVESSDAL